jgi:polar amino acid transport system substrate-binding protein
MKRMKFVVILSLIVGIVFLWRAASAADSAKVSPVIDRILSKKELVVGTAASMPPLNMMTKNGKIIGIEPDLAEMLAKGMEVKLTLKQVQFDELIPALLAGKVDMVLSNVTITPARNVKVAFAGPYFHSGKSILVKVANAPSLDTMEKLNKPSKVLVALKGSTSQMFVEKLIPNAKLELAQDYDQAVDMVKNDKAQAMVADLPICQVSVIRYPEAKLATLEKPFSYEPIGVALPPNDPLLVNMVENTLRLLEKTGDLDALAQKWFKNPSWVAELR